MIKREMVLLVLMLLAISCLGQRRGGGRGGRRSKSRMQIGLPVTGKYRDPESDQYYNNHNNTCLLGLKLRIYNLSLYIERVDSYKQLFLYLVSRLKWGEHILLDVGQILHCDICYQLEGAKILEASHFDYEYVLGHKIAFVCVARGTPRPHITWFKDGVELMSHLYLHVHEWRMGKDKVKSKLEIDPATQMDAGVYECTADNMYSIDRRSFKTDFSIVFD